MLYSSHYVCGYLNDPTQRQKLYALPLAPILPRGGEGQTSRTLANLSTGSREETEAISLALRHQHNLTPLGAAQDQLSLHQGLSVGALWLVRDMAQQSENVRALGTTRAGTLALWQVIARVIDQGSRLSAVRLAGAHAVGDVLGLETFTEDDLYANLRLAVATASHALRIASPGSTLAPPTRASFSMM